MKLKLGFIAAMVALALNFNVQAADKITIMVGGMDKQIYLPAMLAERLGYLNETGLMIELLSEPAGVNAETEMLSGAAQGAVGFYDHTIDLQARGKYTESVVQFSHAPGEYLFSVNRKLQSYQISYPGTNPGKFSIFKIVNHSLLHS